MRLLATVLDSTNIDMFAIADVSTGQHWVRVQRKFQTWRDEFGIKNDSTISFYLSNGLDSSTNFCDE